ncbi:MAG: PE-PPE domain-containing protein [Candidatus Saccharimonadales bacterium]
MAEISTTVVHESLRDASKIDYFSWFENHVRHNSSLDTDDSVRQAKEVDNPQISTAQEDTKDILDISDTEFENNHRTGFVRRMLGRAAGHLNYAVVSGLHIPTTIKEKDHELHEKYADDENDGWLNRRRKHLGRNAIRYSAGTLVGLGATVYGLEMYDKIDTTIASLTTSPVHSVSDYPIRTLEVQLSGIETHFYIGGNGDFNGDMFVQQQKDMNLYDPNDINIQASYSASIYPKDPVQMDESAREVTPQLADAINQADGGPVVVHAFSEGAVAAVYTIHDLDAQGVDVSNVQLVVDGGPYGEMGLFKSDTVQGVSPILESMGINPNVALPSDVQLVVRSYSGDVWGASGDDSLIAQGTMLAGIQGHEPVTPGSTLIATKTVGNVTYEEYAAPHPLSRLTGNTDPNVDHFFDELVPITHLGEETQYANAEGVSDAFATMVDGATGNTGAANRAVDSMMAVPGASNDLQSLLNLEQTPDHITKMMADPATIPTELPQAMNEVRGAVQTSLDYLQNPKKLVDLGNTALQANGIPPLIPSLDNLNLPQARSVNSNPGSGAGFNVRDMIQQVREAIPAPVANTVVPNEVNVPVAPLPNIPVEMPHPIANAFPQFGGAIRQFLGTLPRAR